MSKRVVGASGAVLFIGLIASCGTTGGGVDGGEGGGDGGIFDTIDIDGFGPCAPGTTQCTNCKDDDGDKAIDWQDPECTGPLDDDEATFATGIPGDNIDPCKQDCFFDGNSGSGDDRCDWNLKCDPKSPGAPKCPYDPNYKNCPMQTQPCINFCKPLTPNGCDCFGCCQMPDGDGGQVFVYLGATCSLSVISDTTKCPRCTPVQDCFNPCDKCELCLGKPTLPPECNEGGTMGCSQGQQACNQNMPCPIGQYCLTGCCLPNVN